MYNKLNLIMRGVYRLTCDDPNLVYYGSSADIDKREREHGKNYRLYKSGNTRKYCSSSKLYEVGDVEVEMVFECPDYISKREMEEIEQIYIENDECVNDKNAFLTKEHRKKQLLLNSQTDKAKITQKIYKQTEKCKEAQRDYDFTIRIFKEFA
jgi:hypothetical protein